jgi:hypothetical protein
VHSQPGHDGSDDIEMLVNSHMILRKIKMMIVKRIMKVKKMMMMMMMMMMILRMMKIL